MNNFFVSADIRAERLAICKSCEFYFKPTGSCKKCGCFMSIKSTIAHLSCPVEKWLKTTEAKLKEIPADIVDDINDVWENIKSGVAKNVEAKTKMIDLYNTLYRTNYKNTSNCSSCLQTIFKGIKLAYNKLKND
jgi:long-subunit acyl-CoA synthetase (AMP-forming)